MRTTVNLDDEVAAEAIRLQTAQRISLSEAVNTLARAGLSRGAEPRRPFVQRATHLGLTIDVSNVAEAVDLLDGADHR